MKCVTAFSVVGVVLSFAAPLSGETVAELVAVEGQEGGVFYVGQPQVSDEAAGTDEMFVLVEASPECVGKTYVLTLVRSDEDDTSLAWQATFTVLQAGQQYVDVKLPSVQPCQTAWWVRIEGEAPRPMPKQLRFESGKAAKAAATSQPEDASPAGSPPEGSTVVRDTVVLRLPYPVVTPVEVKPPPLNYVVRLPQRPAWLRPLPPVWRKGVAPLLPARGRAIRGPLVPPVRRVGNSPLAGRAVVPAPIVERRPTPARSAAPGRRPAPRRR